MSSRQPPTGGRGLLAKLGFRPHSVEEILQVIEESFSKKMVGSKSKEAWAAVIASNVE
ncbi:hypothetical protein HPP92_016624 [Vanilla planifolia]|uniref:Uncharacterized protein n=1 Tax=Vanilla planifolia TaxID=51239 RepID=A0A835QIG0_VANPL|nr:hypothetical protein HPP92_016624 [Vanilla planifolia]